jgi:predicted ATP-dependent serine protease
MAQRPLHRVRDLAPALSTALHAAGIRTVRDLLLASPLKLMLITDLSFEEVRLLIRAVSEAIMPESTTALSYLRQRATKQRYLETGIAELDHALHGGLLLGTITDICGQPGIGKTQLCIGCIIQAHQQGGSVVYIDTEHKFDPLRLVQLASEKAPQRFSAAYRSDAAHQIDALLQAVIIKRPAAVSEFETVISELEELAIAKKVSLVSSFIFVSGFAPN